MNSWFRGKKSGLAAFVIISALVAGGLAWVTSAALDLERKQLEERAETQFREKLQRALWRMDGLIARELATEDSRPYNHYSAVFAPPHVLPVDGNPPPAGSVLVPSPLLSADVPEWMLLHFQVDLTSGWQSPQVLSPSLQARLLAAKIPVASSDLAPGRQRLLAELSKYVQPVTLSALLRTHSTRPALEDLALELKNSFVMPGNSMSDKEGQGGNQAQAPNQPMAQQRFDTEYQARVRQQVLGNQPKNRKTQNEDANIADLDNFTRNGENWFSPSKGKAARSEELVVSRGSMVPLWLTLDDHTERLVFARQVYLGEKEICQGVVLDWPRLQTLLAEEVGDLFPQAQVEPVREGTPSDTGRAMAVLPVQLNPGPLVAPAASADWTPLRFGLAVAWVTTMVALLAVALGGRSLIDLSERRIRFVSAVTHELRTPLTTLRLYLDMLAGGMVRDEKRKEEYLQTLNTETDRLNRLVGNVLDFSRLENQRPRLAKSQVSVGELLEQVRSNWQGRCANVEKEIVLANELGDGASLMTDSQLVQQILGNLIDNACKYSREAADRRIWLRARIGGRRRIVLEVEDRGPGVPPRERRSIFRPFRRGKGVDATAGGVGLGLALAHRWSQLLGGKLTVDSGPDGVGACFRVELPL